MAVPPPPGTPGQAILISEGKRKPKIFRFKNVMGRGIKKLFNFIIREIASKIFGKMILKPLQFQKDFKSFPRMNAGTDKNFIYSTAWNAFVKV